MRRRSNAVIALTLALTSLWLHPAPASAIERGDESVGPGAQIVADHVWSDPLDYDLDGWMRTTRGSGAVAHVWSGAAHDGARGFHSRISTAGNFAYYRRQLTRPSTEVLIDFWWRVSRRGTLDASNVPSVRLFGNGTRLADVSRRNDNGVIFLRYRRQGGSFGYFFGPRLPLGSWAHVQFGWSVGGRPFLAVNGTIYHSGDVRGSNVQTGQNAITAVQLGAEHVNQYGDMSVDTLRVSEAHRP